MNLLVTWVLVGGVGLAQDRIVGGVPAEPGEFPDAAALFTRGGTFVCTGTLIAPDLVLTAGHCDFGIDHVVVGATDYTDGGEQIEVRDTFAYPSSWTTYDVAVLVLEDASTLAPRQLASGCAAAEFLADGAGATIAGWGATDPFASDYGTVLMKARVPVVDADCGALDLGCNELVSPGGELIAGGDGTDSCSGDSGGPLYLDTPYGPMLAGVTSRGTDDATVPCGDGGIYARADAVVDWIEATTGRELPEPTCPFHANAPPVPTAPELVTDEGVVGMVRVDPGDPDATDLHWFELASPPAHGVAEVTGNGVVRYRPDPRFDGVDALVVRVRDSGLPQASATVEVQVVVRDTVQGLTITRDGCDHVGAGPWWLAAALLWRRRQRPESVSQPVPFVSSSD